MKANDDVISIRYLDFVKSLKPPSSKGCDHYDEDTKDVISIWPNYVKSVRIQSFSQTEYLLEKLRIRTLFMQSKQKFIILLQHGLCSPNLASRIANRLNLD